MIDAASEQPASRSGISTVFSGQRIAAVSAMKWTPQKTIVDGVGRGRLAREAERVADVVGHVLHLGHLVVVGEDDRVALAGELAHLLVRASSFSTAVMSVRPPGDVRASAPSGSARRSR